MSLRRIGVTALLVVGTLFWTTAFLWLERIRRRTLEEFPDEPPPAVSGGRPRFTRAG